MTGWVTQGPTTGYVSHYSTDHYRDGSVRAACGLTVTGATPAPYRARHQECVRALQEALVEPPARVRVGYTVYIDCNNGDEAEMQNRLAGSFSRLSRVDNVEIAITSIEPIDPEAT